jgi:hypothetical protein
MADRYNLRVTVEINRLGDHDQYTGERLSINQEYTLPVSGFAEIASVLGRFQELAEQVKTDA